MAKQLTWFITGTSSGLGEAFVLKVLARGDRVIAAARNLSKIEHLKAAGAAILELDVTATRATIDAKARDAIAVYGTVDVVVNNAGSAVLGTIEEIPHEKWVEQFNVLVFGQISVTRAFMPHFRERKQGFVIFIGSMGGWKGEALCAPYDSSKFAIRGIAESFQAETEHIGIQTMLVEPGYFRTKLIAGCDVTKTEFEEYEEAGKELHAGLEAYGGHQPGDPAKAAEIIVDIVRQEGVAKERGVPKTLFLGPDCVGMIKEVCEETLKSLKEWEDVSMSTDFSASAP